jgi:hypothetical protein
VDIAATLVLLAYVLSNAGPNVHMVFDALAHRIARATEPAADMAALGHHSKERPPGIPT